MIHRCSTMKTPAMTTGVSVPTAFRDAGKCIISVGISSGDITRRGVRTEKSAIPAKGDCGVSGSAMERSYSERTGARHRRGRPMPLRPGAADHVQGRLVPP